MRSTLTTLVVGATLALTGGVAHASAQTPSAPPTIFMLDTLRDAGHGNVTTTCGDNGPVIHTVLYNDHGGPDETVQVYLEPVGSWNGIGMPVLNQQPSPNPITIPAGGHTAITLPYENGNAVFIAAAVAKGDTLPATDQELEAAMSAHTADSSQLFPPGRGNSGKYEYASAPASCTPPPQTACPPNWPINPFPIEDPACAPHSVAPRPSNTAAKVTATVTATKRYPVPGPTVTKTAVKTATATSTVTATAPGTTSTSTSTVIVTAGGPFPGDQGTESTSVSTTPVADARLAQNGSSALLLTIAAILIAGGGLGTAAVAWGRNRRH